MSISCDLPTSVISTSHLLAPVPEEGGTAGLPRQSSPPKVAAFLTSPRKCCTMEEAINALDTERKERKTDIASLRAELDRQRERVSQLGELLMSGGDFASRCRHAEDTETDNGAANGTDKTPAEDPEKPGIEATIHELRRCVSAQQKQQELQAGALREGLMEIQQQRAALAKIADARHGSPASSSSESEKNSDTPPDVPSSDQSGGGGAFRSLISSEIHRLCLEEMAAVFKTAKTQYDELVQALRQEKDTRIQEIDRLRSDVCCNTTWKSAEANQIVSWQDHFPEYVKNEPQHFDISVSEREHLPAPDGGWTPVMPGGCSGNTPCPDPHQVQGQLLFQEITKDRQRSSSLDRSCTSRGAPEPKLQGTLEEMHRQIECVHATMLSSKIDHEKTLGMLHVEVAKMSRGLEAAESRESVLQQEVAMCTQLSRDAAAMVRELPALLARIQATEGICNAVWREVEALGSDGARGEINRHDEHRNLTEHEVRSIPEGTVTC